jgi:predicted metal-dependent phosphoesterase TrpH
MTRARKFAWTLVAAGAVLGTWTDRPPRRKPLVFGEYRVLACDFHVHPHPLSGSTLTPFDQVLEAGRQELDVLGITPQNGALAGKVGRWFSRAIGGPTVIPGEEIHGPRFHLIALAIDRPVDWRLGIADAIDEVHRQGGVAIAAHPVAESWGAFEAGVRKLDGAEALQPVAYWKEERVTELRQFWERAGVAAIGSSDHHGMGPLGLCRTYVFAWDDSESAILDAIRAGRTVAFDGVHVYGHPDLVSFVRQNVRMPARPSPVSGVLTLLGLAALVLLRR